MKQQIFTTVGNGLSVPYPEELMFGGLILRKDFRMNDFPRTDKGAVWYDVPDEEYLAWLSDYLPENLPELNKDQEKFRKVLHNGSDLSAFWIGFVAGWFDSSSALRPFHDFPPDFAETADFSTLQVSDGGYSYDEYTEYGEDFDLPEVTMKSEEQYILEDYSWHLILQDERQQFQKYWLEFAKRDGVSVVLKVDSLRNEPPDAGWRVFLGLILQRIDSKQERINALEDFYREWQDIISK